MVLFSVFDFLYRSSPYLPFFKYLWINLNYEPQSINQSFSIYCFQCIFQECNICNHELTEVQIHHCRSCGKGFCDDCSTRKKPVPERGWGNDPVRVCDQCYEQGSSEYTCGTEGVYEQGSSEYTCWSCVHQTYNEAIVKKYIKQGPHGS